MKGYGNLSLWSVKEPKRTITVVIYGCEKDKKMLWSGDLFTFKRWRIYSRKKRMRRCKLGMRKGYQLTIKGYEWSIGGIGVRPEGGASAYKILLSAPRFPVRYDDHLYFFGGGAGGSGSSRFSARLTSRFCISLNFKLQCSSS